MRIVFDIQAIQGRSGSRGIGKYSFELLKEACNKLNDHSVYFLYNEALHLDVVRKRELIINCPGATWISLDYPRDSFSNSGLLQDPAVDIRKEIIEALEPEWVHVFSVVEGFDEQVVPHSFGKFHSSCFIYDAIPAIYPEKFLPNAESREWYRERTSTFAKYDSIFAISSSAKAEAVEHFGLPEEKITVLWGGITASNLSIQSNKNAQDIVYVGAFEERKNIPRLIEAFSKSEKYLHKDSNLVLVGKYHDSELAPILRAISETKLESRVEIRGFVTDSELEKVYENARLVVLPSLHEGLGLPLLESMARGIPAVASNTSSMKDILEGLPNTFDPMSLDSISEKIIEFANNVTSREKLLLEFLKRSSSYSWNKAADRFLEIGLRNEDTARVTNNFTKAAVRHSIENLLSRIALWNLNSDQTQEYIVVLSRNFQNLLQKTESSFVPTDLCIQLSGHFKGSYSLSQLNRNVYEASKSFTYEVSVLPEEYDSLTETFLFDEEANLGLYQVPFKAQSLELRRVRIWMRNTYPPIAHDMNGDLNLFHTYNWEETEFPKIYLAEFNNFLDGITFATTFVQKTLIDNGLKIPSTVVGGSSSFALDSIRNRKKKHSASNNFTFLHVSSGFPRKGVDLLLEAFGQAFNKSDKVKLIIKTFPNQHNLADIHLKKMMEKFHSYAEIEFINKDLDDQEMLNLFTKADCVIQPSRGEGFGLPLYEALCFGVPVISTDWGGHKDFISGEQGILVDFDFATSDSHLKNFNSLWAEPKLEELIKAMRSMYEKDFMVQFEPATWQDNFSNNIEFINKLNRHTTVTPKTAWITTFNTRCGIAEYAKGLLNHYPDEEYIVFPPKTTSFIVPEVEASLQRLWTEGSLEVLERAITESDVNVVFIQHNWGLYESESLNNFVESVRQDKIVFIELHSLRDLKNRPHKEIAAIMPSLKAAERLIVHDARDLNLLKQFGLVENVVFLPLAFPNPLRDFDYYIGDRKEIVIGTSGFALPNKRQELLFEVAKNLLGYFSKVSIRYYCSIHSDPSSIDQVNILRDLVGKHPQVDVVVNTSYLTETDLLEELRNCNFLVYAYKDTGETASAAVRDGISSGVPVIVTPSPIFDSARELVFTAGDYSTTKIAEKIIETHKKLMDFGIAQETAERFQKIVSENSRSSISERIQGMSQGLLNML